MFSFCVDVVFQFVLVVSTFFFFLVIQLPHGFTLRWSSAASVVYKRPVCGGEFFGSLCLAQFFVG